MNRLVLLPLLITLFSCGIPEFTYIDVATVKSGTTVNKDPLYTITLPDDEAVDGYLIYFRYYNDNNSKEFQIEDYTESIYNKSADYLKSGLGFKEIIFLDNNDNLVEAPLASDDQIRLIKYSKTTTTEQSIKLGYNNDEIYLGYRDNANSEIHRLGIFEDNNDKSIAQNFLNSGESLGSQIKIEFAIIVKGVKIDPLPETIYSEPLYIGSFDSINI